VLRHFAIPAVFILSFSVAWSQQASASDDTCAKLASLTLPGAKVVSAATVAAGAFMPPDTSMLQPAQKALMGGLPQFCQQRPVQPDSTFQAAGPRDVREGSMSLAR
jgi:hypothetical protein